MRRAGEPGSSSTGPTRTGVHEAAALKPVQACRRSSHRLSAIFRREAFRVRSKQLLRPCAGDRAG
jgi:hypothetical protein